jgi:hypothetical protein
LRKLSGFDVFDGLSNAFLKTVSVIAGYIDLERMRQGIELFCGHLGVDKPLLYFEYVKLAVFMALVCRTLKGMQIGR